MKRVGRHRSSRRRPLGISGPDNRSIAIAYINGKDDNDADDREADRAA